MNSHNNNWAFPFLISTGQGLGSKNQPYIPLKSKPFGLANINCTVNISTGNLMAEDRPIRLSDIGGPIELSYFYNSNAENPTPSWKLKTGRQIKIDKSSSQLTIIENDGHETIYTLKADGCYYSNESGDGIPYIKFNKDTNQYCWNHPKSRIAELFDNKGYLTKRIDALGNETLYETTETGKIKTIISPSGTRYEIRRNDPTVQIYLIDISKVETLIHTYQFENGKLILSKTPDNYEIRYQYDNATGKLKSITQTDASTLQFGYQTIKNQTKLQNIQVGNEDKKHTFVYENNTSTFIDAAGNKTIFQLDNQKRIQTINQATLQPDKSDISKFEYNAQGQLTRKIYPDTSEERFEYYLNSGLLSKQILRDKTSVNYTYSPTGALLQTQYKKANNDSLGVIQYVYETSSQNNAQLLRYKISAEGRVKEYTYNAQGLIESEYEYPDKKDLYKVTDNIPSLTEMENWKNESGRLARRTANFFKYDVRGRVIRKYSDNEDANSPEQLFDYDIIGNCKEKSIKQDAQKYWKSTFSYNNNGNLLRKTVGETQTTTHEYKANQIITTHPNKAQEIKEFDSRDLLKNKSKIIPDEKQAKEYHYECDANGNVISEELPDGHQWKTYYDNQNRPRFTLSPEGAVTQTEYNEEFRYQKKTSYSVKVALDEIKSQADLENLWDQDEKQREMFEFSDVNEQLRYSVDSENFVIEYQYDERNNLTKKIAYAERITREELAQLKKGQNLTRLAIRKQDQITSYFYDKDGYKIAEQNPVGYVTRFERDGRGQITEEIHYSTPSDKIGNNLTEILPPENPAKDGHHYYFYNSYNQCSLEVDAEGYITTYLYYPDGKIQEKIRYETKLDNWPDKTLAPKPIESTKGNDQKINYFYDSLGRKKETYTSHGKIISYSYDEMNNLIHVSTSDANNADEKNINGDNYRASEFKYDGWEHITKEADPLIKEQQLLEDKPDILWKQHFYNERGLKIKSIDGLNHATLYYYTLDGNLALTIDATGAVTENTNNAFGEVEEKRQYYTRIALTDLIKLTGGYINDDVKKLLTKNAAKDVVTQYQRDGRGQIVKKIDPELNEYTFEYNAFKQCKSEILPKTVQSSLEITHEYDSCNNEIKTITTATDKNQSKTIEKKYEHYLLKPTEIKNEAGTRTIFEVDKLGRATKTFKEVSHDQFMTDKDIAYDAFDRVINEINAEKKVTTIEYNQKTRSRIIQSPIADIKITIKENVFGEMVECENGEGDRVTFRHAANGEVREHTVGNQTTVTNYNVAGLKAEEIDANQTKRTFVYNEANQLRSIINDDKKNGLNLTKQFYPNAMGYNETEYDARGIETQNEFDRNGHLVKEIKDASGKAVTVQYGRNAFGDETTRITGDKVTPIQHCIATEYDAYNQVSAKIIDPEGLAIRTEFGLDAVGNVTKETDPNGKITYHFYNLSKKKLFTAKPLNDSQYSLTGWLYSKTGKITETRVFDTPLDAKLLNDNASLQDIQSWAKPNNKCDSVNQYFYDDNDREQYQVTVIWNASQKNYENIILEKEYDKANRVVTKKYYSNSVITAEFPEWKKSNLESLARINEDKDQVHYYWYDTASRERFIIDQSGGVREKRYDNEGHVVAEILYSKPLNDFENASLQDIETAVQQQIDPTRDRATYKVFDSIGREIFTVNPNGSVTRKDYDENNNLVKICKFKDSVKDFKDYDALVDLLKQKIPDRQKDTVTEHIYDKLNHIETTTDALGNSESFERNAFGHVLSHTDRAKQIWQFRYDSANRLVKEISPKTLVTVPFVTPENKLNFVEVKSTITKKTDFDKAGNTRCITDGILEDGVDPKLAASRSFELNYNAANKPSSTLQSQILVDDESKPGSLITPPEKEVTLQTKTVWDRRGNKLVEIDESGSAAFDVFDNANRIILKIDKEGYATKYSYNSFDQPTEVLSYATKLPDLSQYYETGLTQEVAFENIEIKQSPEDRIKETAYDHNGRLVGIKTGKVFYYSDGKYGLAQPETKKEFNTLNDCTIEYRLIRPDVWSKKFCWYDKCDQLIAEVDENNYLTRCEYNAAGKMESKKEYATPLSFIPTLETTVSELDQDIKLSESDRFYTYGYDLLGQRTSETILNVTTEALQVDEKTSVPSIKVNEKKSLKREWKYSPTQKLIKRTFEDGSPEYKYYDERGLKIAETEVPRRSQDIHDNGITVTPLKINKYNAFGQVVVTQSSNKGGTLPDEKSVPTLILTAAADDAPAQLVQAVNYYDNRGLVKLQQNARNNITRYTYAPSRKIAREIHGVSLFRRTDGINFTADLHFDENKFKYDKRGRTIQLSRLRDNQVERQNYSRYNAFDELTGECFDGVSWNSFKRMDLQGNVWFTNGAQGGIIQLYDLKGAETLHLQSRDMDLQLVKYTADELTNLLMIDSKNFDRTETTRDAAGRPLTRKFPIWFKDKLPQPTRTYVHDRWNMTKETNSLGYSKDYEFTHHDKLRKVTRPEVTVVQTVGNKVIVDEEKQVFPRKRPETFHGHNERGFKIGTTNANGNTHGNILDEAGQSFINILGDGTATRQIHDARGQVVRFIDSLNHQWFFGYDPMKNLVSEMWPIHNFDRSYQYDELEHRIADVDAMGRNTRYNHDASGNISERFLHLGQRTGTVWENNHRELEVTNPDGDTLTWQRDYFGAPISHKDSKDRITIFEHDFKKDIKKQYQTSGEPWGSMEVNKGIIYPDPGHQYPAVTFEPRVFSDSRPQNLTFDYAFGSLESITDTGLLKKSSYIKDSEGRATQLEITSLSDQTLLYRIKTSRDELGREATITDERLSDKMFTSTMTAKLLYDAASNRKNIDITTVAAGYSAGCTVVKRKDHWNLFDRAERLTLTNGVVTPDRLIQLAPFQGFEMGYDRGFRISEARLDPTGFKITASISYSDNSLLASTVAYIPTPLITECSYSPVGYIDGYAETFNGKKISKIGHFNENAWQNDVVTTDSSVGLVNATRTLDFYQNGLSRVEQFRDEKTTNIENRTNTYLRTDSWKLCVVNATLTSPFGTGPVATAQFLNDSNGVVCGKIDSQDESYGNGEPPKVYIDTVPQGWLMSKQCLLNRANRQTNYFHSITGQLLGGYTSGYMDMLSSIPRTEIITVMRLPDEPLGIPIINPNRIDEFIKSPAFPTDGIILDPWGNRILYYLSNSLLRAPNGEVISPNFCISGEDFQSLVPYGPVIISGWAFARIHREATPQLFDKIIDVARGIIGASQAYDVQRNHFNYHAFGMGQDIKPDVGDLNIYSHVHPIARIYPTDPDAKNNPLDWDDPQLMSNLGLDTYVVRSGDTFKSIAKELSGDSSNALKIARCNGFGSHKFFPTPGLILRVPQFIASKNNINITRPNQDFMRVVTGSLSPVLTAPNFISFFSQIFPLMNQLNDDDDDNDDPFTDFLETSFKIVAITLVVIAAQEFAPAVLTAIGFGAASTGEIAVMAGGLAAAGDAVVQEAFDTVTGQSFSYTEMIETAVTAGISLPKLDFLKATNGSLTVASENALKIGAAALATQTAEIAANLRGTYDFRAVATQVASSVLASKINDGVKGIIKNTTSQNVASNITNSFSNAVIDNVVTHTPLDIRLVAANAMGSTAGEEAGERIIEQQSSKNAPTISKKDIDMSDPKSTQDLTDLNCRQQQAQSLRTEATESTHSYLLDNDRIAKYSGMFLGGVQQPEQPSNIVIPIVKPQVQSSNIGTRIMGGLQAIGGLAEAAAGVSLGVLTAETGVGVAVGAATYINGIDNYQAGFKTAFSGADQPTIFEETVAPTFGIDPQIAQAMEIGLGMGNVGFSAAKLSKFGMFRASLANGADNDLAPKMGEKVYRVWGDESASQGKSWTRQNPADVDNYRSKAGLPNQNTGRFFSEGYLINVENVTQRSAIPLHGNEGGLDEILVPNPNEQIRLTRVLGVNPPF